MATTKRQVLHGAEIAYPELHPVRHIEHRSLHSRNRKKLTRQDIVLYLLINAALLFGIGQCLRTLIIDSLDLSRLLNSHASVERFSQQTRQENRALGEKIRIYSSASGIEELARNYLNMVGQNELPVRFQ